MATTKSLQLFFNRGTNFLSFTDIGVNTLDLLYSKRTSIFRSYCLSLLHDIIRNETEYRIHSTRFQIGEIYYPLHVCVFLEKDRLGYCIPELFEIGINSLLIDTDESTIKNILRHELAHLFTFLRYGDVPSHGKEFHEVCAFFSWPKEVAKASTSLQERKNKQRIQSKVQKLLALSHSSNQAEALSALEKAQQLINQYALSKQKEEEEWISRRVLHTDRLDQKMKTIAHILRQFHVIPTFHSHAGGVYLDLFGNHKCIEYGEQIAHYLSTELEHLWNTQTCLRGARQRKSFFIGISIGFSESLEQKERALLKYDETVAKAYRSFTKQGRTLRENYSVDTLSKKIGQKEGKHLSIPKAASPSFIPGIQWQRDSSL